MKKITSFLALGFLFSLGLGSGVYAQETTQEDQELEQTASEMDREAGRPEGRKAVESRLQDQYQVDQARIDSLRDKKLGYGEIAHTLSLAQKMPGGINNENVQKVMDLRQGEDHKMGWGNVAKTLGFKLGPTVSGTQRAEKPERGKGEFERPAKPERREKSEKPERPERPEKPARSEKAKR